MLPDLATPPIFHVKLQATHHDSQQGLSRIFIRFVAQCDLQVLDEQVKRAPTYRRPCAPPKIKAGLGLRGSARPQAKLSQDEIFFFKIFGSRVFQPNGHIPCLYDRHTVILA